MEHEEDPSTASERLSHGNSQLVGLTPHRVRKKTGPKDISERVG